jgi:hypothetical protein
MPDPITRRGWFLSSERNEENPRKMTPEKSDIQETLLFEEILRFKLTTLSSHSWIVRVKHAYQFQSYRITRPNTPHNPPQNYEFSRGPKPNQAKPTNYKLHQLTKNERSHLPQVSRVVQNSS